MGFPVTKLPYIPLRKVLAGIDAANQLELSFVADNVRDALNSLRKSSTETVIRVTPAVMDITMTVREDDDSSVKVQLKLERVVRKPFHIKLYGNKIAMTRTKNVLKFRREKTIDKNYEYLNLLLAHLDRTFKLSGLSVILEYSDITGYLFKNFKSFESIKIFNQDLTPELGWFFFKNVQTKELVFRATSVQMPNGPHDFPLTHSVIELDSCNWLQFASIVNMKCQRFTVGKGDKGDMKITDIVDFVYAWSNGELNELVECQIDIPKIWLKQDLRYGYARAIFDKLVSLGVQTFPAGDLKKKMFRRDKKIGLLTINTIFKCEFLPPTSANDPSTPVS